MAGPFRPTVDAQGNPTDTAKDKRAVLETVQRSAGVPIVEGMPAEIPTSTGPEALAFNEQYNVDAPVVPDGISSNLPTFGVNANYNLEDRLLEEQRALEAKGGGPKGPTSRLASQSETFIPYEGDPGLLAKRDALEMAAGEADKQKFNSQMQMFGGVADAQRDLVDHKLRINKDALKRSNVFFDEAQESLVVIREMMDKARAGQANPNQFFANVGEAGTFAAAVAIGTGALVSSLIGGPNVAKSIIDTAIKRNIETQKFNIENNRAMLAHSMAWLDRLQNLGVTEMEMSQIQQGVYESITLSIIDQQRASALSEEARVNMDNAINERELRLADLKLKIQQARHTVYRKNVYELVATQSAQNAAAMASEAARRGVNIDDPNAPEPVQAQVAGALTEAATTQPEVPYRPAEPGQLPDPFVQDAPPPLLASNMEFARQQAVQRELADVKNATDQDPVMPGYEGANINGSPLHISQQTVQEEMKRAAELDIQLNADEAAAKIAFEQYMAGPGRTATDTEKVQWAREQPNNLYRQIKQFPLEAWDPKKLIEIGPGFKVLPKPHILKPDGTYGPVFVKAERELNRTYMIATGIREMSSQLELITAGKYLIRGPGGEITIRELAGPAKIALAESFERHGLVLADYQRTMYGSDAVRAVSEWALQQGILGLQNEPVRNIIDFFRDNPEVRKARADVWVDNADDRMRNSLRKWDTPYTLYRAK